MKSPYNKFSSGFTLIEVLVMTSLAVIILLSSVSLFMTFLLNQATISQRQKVRTEGDNALKQMVQLLREAKSIENCETASTTNSIVFKDVDNNEATFLIKAQDEGEGAVNRIVLQADNEIFLTTKDLQANDLLVNCSYNQNQGTYFIRFSFDLINPKRTLTDKELSQTFEASVSLRN